MVIQAEEAWSRMIRGPAEGVDAGSGVEEPVCSPTQKLVNMVTSAWQVCLLFDLEAAHPPGPGVAWHALLR